ncbi:MAG TPA: hypothetical protein VK747_10930 [Blastocatellia bacterium]|nr:hypothetical protein [Blastocatellia bacterium]
MKVHGPKVEPGIRRNVKGLDRTFEELKSKGVQLAMLQPRGERERQTRSALIGMLSDYRFKRKLCRGWLAGAALSGCKEKS